MRNSILSVLLLAASVAACNSSNERDERPGGASANPTGAAGSGAGANPTVSPAGGTGMDASVDRAGGDAHGNSDEQQFLQRAALGGEAEVQMARLAQQKASDTRVRNLARQIEQEHLNANSELRQIAGRMNVPITMPLGTEHDAQRAELETKSGAEFDREYTQMLIAHHQKDISEFERAAGNATNDLRAFIDKTLPVLRRHLTQSQALAAALGER